MAKKRKFNQTNKKRRVQFIRMLDLLKECKKNRRIISKNKTDFLNLNSIDLSELLPPKKGDSLLKKPHEYKDSSIIGRGLDYLVAQGYYEIALLGVKEINKTESNEKKDSLIYSVLFNFRHYLEIIIKDSIRRFKKSSGEISSNQIGYHKTHDLLEIWKILKSYIAETTEATQAFEKLINQIHSLDKGGNNLRYVYSTKKEKCERSFKDIIEIDSKNLENIMKKMAFFIEGINHLSYIEKM